MPPKRAIYSVEQGVEFIEESEIIPLEDHATIVVAVLQKGIGVKPISEDQIDVIYCPHCGWLEPYQSHLESCPHTGHVLM